MATNGSRRGQQLTSEVWVSFRYLLGTGPNGEDQAECYTCHSRLKAGRRYGTNLLWRHVGSDKCKAGAEEYLQGYMNQLSPLPPGDDH